MWCVIITRMDSNINQLLAEMDKVAQKVSQLEDELVAAKAKGKELFKEFQKKQAEVAARFGFVTEGPAAARRGKRQPRSIESRIMTSVTRLVNALAAEGTGIREARAQVMETALKVARKNGASEIPAGAIQQIEAKLKGMGKAK